MRCIRATFIDILSKALDPVEREYVLGDMAELELDSVETARNLCGLVVRRQIQPLLHWQPWLLLTLVVPAALLLSVLTVNTATGNAVPLWMYTANWTPSYLQPGWLWSELIPGFGSMAVSWLILACWSWTSGLLLASTKQLKLPLVAVTLVVVIVATVHDQFVGSVPGFFYRRAFPIMLQIVLFLAPFLLGMRHHAGAAKVDGISLRIVWICQFVTMSALLSNAWIDWHLRFLHMPRVTSFAPLALVGPLAFILFVWFSNKKAVLPAGKLS